MMSRWILVSVLCLTTWSYSVACDACGCSIMGQSNGLLASYRKSYIAMGYTRAGFSAVPGTGEGAGDAFHTFDLSFGYYFSDRLRADVYLPYRLNTRTINRIQRRIHGLSDMSLDVQYTFLRGNQSTSLWEINLEAGAGIILPSGKHDPDIHARNLPENFNPGNGSFGISLQQTSGISRQSFGMVLKNTWTNFAKTSSAYTYGSQWVSNLLLLVELPLDSTLTFVPLGSIQFEKVWSDQYATGTEVHGTGGNGVFLATGGLVKMNNWICTFQYAIPVAAHYSSGEVTAGNRYILQMTHLF